MYWEPCFFLRAGAWGSLFAVKSGDIGKWLLDIKKERTSNGRL